MNLYEMNMDRMEVSSNENSKNDLGLRISWYEYVQTSKYYIKY